MAGESVLDVWLGGEPVAPHAPLYFEFCTEQIFTTRAPQNVASWGHAVRNGTWKAVSFALEQPFELYDLSVDLGESNDVAALYPEVVAAMVAFANASHVDNPYFPVVNCVPS